MGVLRAGGHNIKSDDYVAVWTVNDVILSRVMGNSYTNNSGKTMFVIVSFIHSVTVAGGRASAYSEVDGSPAQRQLTGLLASPVMQMYSTLVCVIKPGSSYSINSAEVNGTNGVSSWLEVY